MTTRTRAIGSVLLVAIVALAGATGFAAAASGGSVTSDPVDPGATATHTVTATVTGGASGGSWTGLAVNYSDADVSNVGQGDIAKIGIDRGDNQSGTSVDVDVSDSVDSVSADNNGHKLLVGLDGSYSLHQGDEIVVVYDDVQNPNSEGSYDVGIDVNPQSSGGETAATLSVGSTQSSSAGTNDGSASGTDTTTKISSSSGSGSGGASDSGATTTTQAQSPGFGLAVGAIALFGAALVALWRQD